MKKKLYIGLYFVGIFILWTILVSMVDVKQIGPSNSEVGLASLNGYIHNKTKVNMLLYSITDWLGIIPLCIIIGFGILGLVQWIKRKNLFKVDYTILLLGIYYIVVLCLYLLFETVIVNHRPILIDGILEASYPSSTTLLVLSVMLTALTEIKRRLKRNKYKRIISTIVYVFIFFMVIGRFVSGVHWFTDIVGGILLSTGLVMLYGYFSTNYKQNS